jgi:heme A synthase
MAVNAVTVRRRTRLDRSLNGYLLAVALQFILGIWLNLYGGFPSSNSAASAITDAGDPALVLHTLLGLLLFVGSVGIVVQALRDPYKPVRVLAVTGMIAVLLTGLFGFGFVYSGYANNAYSLGMAIGLLAVVTIYYETLVALRSHPLGGLNAIAFASAT